MTVFTVAVAPKLVVSIDPEGIGAYPCNAADYRPEAPHDKLAQYQPCKKWNSASMRFHSTVPEDDKLGSATDEYGKPRNCQPPTV